MEVSGQLHATAALPHGKEPPVPSGEEAWWTPDLSSPLLSKNVKIEVHKIIIFL
jgi:hypothetical protein